MAKKTPVHGTAEQDLIRRCIQRDEEAYRELIARVEKPLINFIYRYAGERHEAEDIFQETWIKVMGMIRYYKPTAALTTWIFTIARNTCLDHLKYRRRHPAQSLDAVSEKNTDKVIYFANVVSSQEKSPEKILRELEQEELVQKALAQLTLKQREAFALRLYAGFSYEEIAEIVHAPVGTVKYRVHEALRVLTRVLGTATSEKKSDLKGGQSHAM